MPSYLPLAPPSQVESSASYSVKPYVLSVSIANCETVHDFIFDLFRSAEDVRVVLRKSADAQQSVHDAGTLIAVDRTEFAQTDRQVAILRIGRGRSECGTGSSSA